MSTVYTLKTNSIELVNADKLSFSQTQFTSNNYKFKISVLPKTKKECDVTRTVYHSITHVKFTSAMIHFPVPLWEIKKVASLSAANTTQPETTQSDITVGRVTVTIVFPDNANNSTKKKLFRLVGGIPGNSTVSATTVSTSNVVSNTNLFGTNSSIYKSQFFIPGKEITAANNTTSYKYIFDLNKSFSCSTDDNFFVLGLELNDNTIVDSSANIQTCVEIIS